MGHFIVLGLDNFGYNTALALARRRHEVLVLDRDEARVRAIEANVTKAIAVDLSDGRNLDQLLDSSFDAAIVSVGKNIPCSVLTVLRLKELGIDNIVAKAVSARHEQILRLVGARETIVPERTAADGIAMKLTTKNLVEHIPLAEDYSIVEIAVPDELTGKTLGEINMRNRYNVEVIAVKNVLLNEFHLVPRDDLMLEADCALVVIGKQQDTASVKL